MKPAHTQPVTNDSAAPGGGGIAFADLAGVDVRKSGGGKAASSVTSKRASPIPTADVAVGSDKPRTDSRVGTKEKRKKRPPTVSGKTKGKSSAATHAPKVKGDHGGKPQPKGKSKGKPAGAPKARGKSGSPPPPGGSGPVVPTAPPPPRT